MTAPDSDWLQSTLGRLPSIRVGVFGDFCLDAYWTVDAESEEISIETGLAVRQVREQRYAPGGAGNVAVNLAALGVGGVEAVGLLGNDLFGGELRRRLDGHGVETGGLLTDAAGWSTLVYAKPHLRGQELSRIDFGAFGEIDAASIDALAARLDEAAARCDAVVLNQQLVAGVSTPAMIDRINAIVSKHPDTPFLVDARHRADLYRGVILKINAHEAAWLCGEAIDTAEPVDTAAARVFAGALHARTKRPVFVTRGGDGILISGVSGTREQPAVQVVRPTDPVGAGDTVIAALAAALGAGASPETAARLASHAASITVQKLQVTGAATPDELLELGPEPDYVHRPELADHPDQAQRAPGTRIEIVRAPTGRRVTHAVFDHDGTLTSLRRGWEDVMAGVMVGAVLGPHGEKIEQRLRSQVERHVRELIDRTTGIQTLVQMKQLVELVRNYELCPPDQILDEHGYKALYKKLLVAEVEKRLAGVREQPERAAEHLIPGAADLLKALRQRGVELHLASGSDHEDVNEDVDVLGLRPFFEDRVHGAVGDISKEAKKMVLDALLDRIGSGAHVLAVGDGPVEMREVRRRGGLALGVASDEDAPGQLHHGKRSRLIRAGADLIVADFTETDALLQQLGF